jgi:hypothetical protein
MLKRMTVAVLAHRPTCGMVAGAALLPNVGGSSLLFRPVGGAQLGAGGRFYHLAVLKGERRAVHSQTNASRERLADVMGVHEAMKVETAVENSETVEALSPGDAAIGEDDDELASKSKVRTRISNISCIFFLGDHKVLFPHSTIIVCHSRMRGVGNLHLPL